MNWLIFEIKLRDRSWKRIGFFKWLWRRRKYVTKIRWIKMGEE